MSIDIVIEDARWSELEIDALAEAAASAVFARLGLTDAEPQADMLACDDVRIAELNTEFRGKPAPTNVLSWPSEDLRADADGATPAPPGEHFGEMALGDIAIAYDTCLREAAEQSKPVQAHVSHLIVHGLLHLLGYDHIRDRDATLMENLETEILGNMGFNDPYKD